MKSKLKQYKVTVRRSDYKTFLVCGADKQDAVKEAMFQAHRSKWEDVDFRSYALHTAEEVDSE